jgi:hypothetical protein
MHDGNDCPADDQSEDPGANGVDEPFDHRLGYWRSMRNDFRCVLDGVGDYF